MSWRCDACNQEEDSRGWCKCERDQLRLSRLEEVEAENAKLRAALEKALPIVEEAYWDQHTAGRLPGSGYNCKAQSLAGRAWGWWSSDAFERWAKETRQLVESGQGEVKS